MTWQPSTNRRSLKRYSRNQLLIPISDQVASKEHVLFGVPGTPDTMSGSNPTGKVTAMEGNFITKECR
jgi:hypothetical protein